MSAMIIFAVMGSWLAISSISTTPLFSTNLVTSALVITSPPNFLMLAAKLSATCIPPPRNLYAESMKDALICAKVYNGNVSFCSVNFGDVPESTFCSVVSCIVDVRKSYAPREKSEPSDILPSPARSKLPKMPVATPSKKSV